MTTVILPLSPFDALCKWNVIANLLDMALVYEEGKYNLDDIKRFIGEELAQTWVALIHNEITGVAITQIIEYPQKVMLLVLCLAGKDFHLWDNIVHEHFIPYAEHNGCHGIEFHGRKGWARRAKSLGFNLVQHVYELPIKDDGSGTGNITQLFANNRSSDLN